MLLKHIKANFSDKIYNNVKSLINLKKEIINVKARKCFLIYCRKHNVLPKNISNALHNLKNLFFFSTSINLKIKESVRNLEKTLLNSEIKDIFNHLNLLNSEMNNILIDLRNSAHPDLYNDILNNQINFDRCVTKKSKKLKKKFEILIKSTRRNNSYIVYDDSQQHVNLTNKSYDDNKQVNDPWFNNLSDTTIPNSVIDILRLGEKFNSPHLTSKQNIIFQIVKDVESNMNFIEGGENRDVLRHRILNVSCFIIFK